MSRRNRPALNAQDAAEITRLTAAVDAAKTALRSFSISVSWKQDSEEYEKNGCKKHDEAAKSNMRAMFAMLADSQVVFYRSEGRMASAVVQLPSPLAQTAAVNSVAPAPLPASSQAVEPRVSSSTTGSINDFRYLHVYWSFNDDPYDHRDESASFSIQAFASQNEAVKSAANSQQIRSWGTPSRSKFALPSESHIFSFDYTSNSYDIAPNIEEGHVTPVMHWLAARGIILLPKLERSSATSNPVGLSVARHFLLFVFNAITEGLQDFERCSWEVKLFSGAKDLLYVRPSPANRFPAASPTFASPTMSPPMPATVASQRPSRKAPATVAPPRRSMPEHDEVEEEDGDLSDDVQQQWLSQQLLTPARSSPAASTSKTPATIRSPMTTTKSTPTPNTAAPQTKLFSRKSPKPKTTPQKKSMPERMKKREKEDDAE